MSEQKVLLVDDQDYSRQLLRNNLTALVAQQKVQRHSFSYYQAHNATNALNVFSNQLPGLVFLDIEMPGGSGLELIQKFKQIKPDCFVVMVSGVSTLKNVKTSLEWGAASFLAKPFTGDKLIQVLKQYERHLLKIAQQTS